MSKTQEDLIQFRLEKAAESFEMAEFAISKKYWGAAASELYYTCYYLVLALFAKHQITTFTHSGVNSLFALRFIKENKIDIKWGKLLRTLFDKRQKGDYGDFMILTEEEILPLVSDVIEFTDVVTHLINE